MNLRSICLCRLMPSKSASTCRFVSTWVCHDPDARSSLIGRRLAMIPGRKTTSRATCPASRIALIGTDNLRSLIQQEKRLARIMLVPVDASSLKMGV